MTDGLRVELAISCRSHCPVADASAGIDGGIGDVSQAVVGGERLDEYRVPRETTGAVGTPVFETSEEVVYRASRPCGTGCPCERIEAAGCPTTSVRAVDGRLVVSFYAPDRETVRRAVEALQGDFDVELRRLVASGDSEVESDPTVVDRAHLTDRQREVIETAHRLGYFEYPRRATAEAVAGTLGSSPSAFAETLRAAERAVLDEFFPAEEPTRETRRIDGTEPT
jgi:predicted DNA binding protein